METQHTSISLRWMFICFLTIVYVFLFYHQNAGLNFFLYSLFMVPAAFLMEPKAIKRPNAIILGLLTLLSGFTVYLHSSTLAVTANIFCLFLLPAYILKPNGILPVQAVSVILSTGGSLILSVIRLAVKKDDDSNDDAQSTNANARRGKNILTIGIPILVIVLFFFIYRGMNPLFKNATKVFSFDFLTFGSVLFAMGGMVMLIGYFFHYRITSLDNWLEGIPVSVHQEKLKPESRVWNEGKAFVIMFLALNLMLLLINGMDLNYLYLGSGMPEGVTHKEFVHNGVGMLILSIILGITVLLVFFRGHLNFNASSRMAKILAYVWIGQNLFMIGSTAIRNDMYIQQALLTYKRIGVYFWLGFAVIGLVLTLVKIMKQRTTWFIVKHKLNMILAVFVLSSSVDWDWVISSYNLEKMSSTEVEDISGYDKTYLLALSERNLTSLYEIRNKKGFEVDSSYSYRANRYNSNKNWLDLKLYDFVNQVQNEEWKSTSVRKKEVLREVNELNAAGTFKMLDLRELGNYSYGYNRYDDLDSTTYEALKYFNGLEELHITRVEATCAKTFNQLPDLKRIYLSGFQHGNRGLFESSLDSNIELIIGKDPLVRFPDADSLQVEVPGEVVEETAVSEEVREELEE